MAKENSEIGRDEDASFDLSLHVFVSRLFGWTLLEGAVRGAHCSLKKKRKKKNSPVGKKSGNGPLFFPNKRKLIFWNNKDFIAPSES